MYIIWNVILGVLLRTRNSQRSVGNTKDDPDKDAIKTSGCGRTYAHV